MSALTGYTPDTLRFYEKSGGGADIVTVDTIGAGRIEHVTFDALRERFDAAYQEA